MAQACVRVARLDRRRLQKVSHTNKKKPNSKGLVLRCFAASISFRRDRYLEGLESLSVLHLCLCVWPSVPSPRNPSRLSPCDSSRRVEPTIANIDIISYRIITEHTSLEFESSSTPLSRRRAGWRRASARSGQRMMDRMRASGRPKWLVDSRVLGHKRIHASLPHTPAGFRNSGRVSAVFGSQWLWLLVRPKH